MKISSVRATDLYEVYMRSFDRKAFVEHEIFNGIKQQCTVDDQLIYAGTLLKRASAHYPTKPALITPERTLTYNELYIRTVKLSEYLKHTFSIGPRDRVVISYENSIEFYLAFCAVSQLGGVCVPLNTFLHERELLTIMHDCTPKLVIVSQSLKHNFDTLYAHDQLNISPPVISTEVFNLEQALNHHDELTAQAFVPAQLDSDELCTLLYTSGTTGSPKGVMLSSRNILTNAMQAYARFTAYGLSDSERFFCVLPLFHAFTQNACLWLPLIVGATIIIISKIDRKLIAEGLKAKPTVFVAVPPLYGLLCMMRTAQLDSVKLFVAGADMLPDKIRAGFALIYGRRICAGYGLSEASPVVAFDDENALRPTSVVGKPLIGIDCQIRDDEGTVLGTNTIGTLWIKGDNIMMGYYNAPDVTAKILINGWLNTGDLASLDNEGNIAIRGRSKDIIIHKGFNIYPAEVENILMMHPAVLKVAVIGEDEETSGQIPIAYVALRPDTKNIESALRSLCSKNLASYKVPRKIICLGDLPMNATGKIDKKKLTSPSAQPTTSI
jgi:long-chain acyl-CoA synthetase